MKRSGFPPNQQHQGFTSLQTFSYNQHDKSSKSKHNYHNHDSSSTNNYNYNYQPNRNNFRKKSNNNQHRISVERPKEKQTATTAFSIGIGQDQISTSFSTSSLNQTEIKIERKKSSKLEFRSSFNQNIIISAKNVSENLTSDSNEISTEENLAFQNEEELNQQNQYMIIDKPSKNKNYTKVNDDQVHKEVIQVPMKEVYTPEDILTLKPLSSPSKRIQASGFITFLRFFSENSNDYDDYRYRKNDRGFKKNRNNRNFIWKNGKPSSKKMALREHSENRFVGLSMVSRAGLSNEFSDEIKRSQAQLILNKLSKINITRSLSEIQSLQIPIDIIIDVLLNTATSDSDFPERNPQIGNMLDFTFRYCSINNEFKSKLVTKSLLKSEEINNKKNPFSPIGSLQSTITWLAALFAGCTITDDQFVTFANHVIEKQPIERALEVIRTGLYVAGKSLDQRNKDLGEPLFEFLQDNRSKHGYTNFLVSELFYLRSSKWSLSVIGGSQSNGNRKKTLNIIKRSISQSIIQEKQNSNASLSMASSSSTSNLSKLATHDINTISDYYNDAYLLQNAEEIELLYLNNKVTEGNAFDCEDDSKIQSSSNSILNYISNHKIESIIHTCFFLFKKYIQNANDFAYFTEQLILTFLKINKINIKSGQNNSDSSNNAYAENRNDNDMNNNSYTEENPNENDTDKSKDNNNTIIQNSFVEKITLVIFNEQSLFESIVIEEESKQLWFPVFMLNAYLYSDNIINFDFVIQSYLKIPDNCFKPSKISFINKIAEITGVSIDEVEKLYQIFHVKLNEINEEQSKKEIKEEPKILLNTDDRCCKTNKFEKLGNLINSEENNTDEKLVEALINLCNPLEISYKPKSEIAAGTFIRDIFDEIFDNGGEEIDFEKIKFVFDPYKQIVDELVKNFRKVTTKIILKYLKQCQIDEKEMKSAMEFFHIE